MTPRALILTAAAACLGAMLSPGATRAVDASRLTHVEAARVAEAEAGRAGRGAPAHRSETPGSDPVRIMRLPGTDRHVVLLRGSSELLLTDGRLAVLDRTAAPRGTSGLALVAPDRLAVCGELSGVIAVYRLGAARLERLRDLTPRDVVSIRDLVHVAGSRRLYLLDPFDRRLHELDLRDAPDGNLAIAGQRAWTLGPGPDRIARAGDFLIVNLVLGHELVILPLGRDGVDATRTVRLAHAGPVWGFAARATAVGLTIVAGGVEDLPLDRTAGEFDHMDSFLYVHELGPRLEVRSRRTLNLSAHGVLTPRSLAFDSGSGSSAGSSSGSGSGSGAGGTVWVAGSGSRRLARVALGRDGPRVAEVHEIPPGATDLAIARGPGGGAQITLASPLADSVWCFEPGRGKVAALDLSPALTDRASQLARLGEYLVFTDMLSPANVADGPRSRLTCEACHFEGGGDGRLHFTGREKVRLTPKSLRGLVDNVPLFSRAGDPTLASMTMAEFKVANQGRRATFTVDPSLWPGLPPELVRMGAVDPPTQREAFLTFLARFRHRPNPQALAAAPGPGARRGLEVFRTRCEACHQARTTTREPAAVLPPDRWLASLQSEADRQEAAPHEETPVVWAAPFMAKTGIRPYPSAAGTRVPSLRRVWTKYPYFTDGSSTSLAGVLARFRHRDGRSWHHHDPALEEAGPAPRPLEQSEIRDLLEALRWF